MTFARQNTALLDPIGFYFNLAAPVQFLIWFCIILVAKYSNIATPPVWDTAMGVFPPAIYLAENNFDLLSLVQQANFFEGGPNVHSYSIWTWLTAAAISSFEDTESVFRFLHLITFALSAWGISTFVRILKYLKVNSSLSLVSGFVLFIIPLVLVQIGYMYVEIPIMTLSILAAARWSEGKEGLAVSLSILAISIKLTGAAIAIALFSLLLVRTILDFRLRRLLYLLLIPISIVLTANLPVILGGVARDASPSWEYEATVWYQLWARLVASPDISILVLSGLLSAVLFTVLYWRKQPLDFSLRNLMVDLNDNGLIYLMVAFSFVFVAGILAMTLADKMFLQRYWRSHAALYNRTNRFIGKLAQ